MRPLYIKGATDKKINLDGPALKVIAREQADRYIPLKKISRITSIGRVEWQTEALLACCKRKIPITFMDGKAQIQGQLAPPINNSQPINAEQLLEEYLYDLQSPEKYRQWLQALETQQIAKLPAQYRNNEHNPEKIKQAIYQKLFPLVIAQKLKAYENKLTALIYEKTSASLLENGISNTHNDLQLRGINLSQDIAHLALWQLQKSKITYIKKQHKIAERKRGGKLRLEWQHAVELIEENKKIIEEEIELLIYRLKKHLLSEVARNGY